MMWPTSRNREIEEFVVYEIEFVQDKVQIASVAGGRTLIQATHTKVGERESVDRELTAQDVQSESNLE